MYRFLLLFVYAYTTLAQDVSLGALGGSVDDLVWCGQSVVFTRDDETVE
jgi:hypothetical protein